jgi:hypothetical protein
MNYKFSPYIRENYQFLNKLAKTRSDNKKYHLILQATPEQILSIVEICANILRSNFVLNTRQKRRLARYAEYYRAIARARTENTARKRIQQGGQLAIATLLAPVLSAVAQTVLDKVIHRNNKEG